MAAPIRVTWQQEGCIIIADKQPGKEWEFADKDLGGVRWHPLDSTPALIATAEAMLAQRTNAPALLPLSAHAFSHPIPSYCRPRP